MKSPEKTQPAHAVTLAVAYEVGAKFQALVHPLGGLEAALPSGEKQTILVGLLSQPAPNAGKLVQVSANGKTKKQPTVPIGIFIQLGDPPPKEFGRWMIPIQGLAECGAQAHAIHAGAKTAWTSGPVSPDDPAVSVTVHAPTAAEAALLVLSELGFGPPQAIIEGNENEDHR